ncbi:hypothetical protein ACT3XD_19725, partial [Halomonas sp. AOP7-B1-5]
LKTCDWHDLPFGNLMATPEDGYPIAKFTYLEDGFYQVVQAIKKILKELGAVSHSDAQVEGINNFVPPTAHSTQRSSNLAWISHSTSASTALRL